MEITGAGHSSPVNDAQIGSVYRAVRIRRRRTQTQVAEEAGVSRSVVSLIECGHIEHASLDSIRRVSAALGISMRLEPHWRGADLARLLDERHAAVVQAVSARLAGLGWQIRPEHTFSVWGERGSIDVFAFHPDRRALLCIEVKAAIADMQDLLSTMDRKRRLAPGLARDLGWESFIVGSVLAIPDETWARNAVAQHGAVFGAALPMRTVDVKRWLKQPEGEMRGIWFLLNAKVGSAMRISRRTARVRVRNAATGVIDPRSARGRPAVGSQLHDGPPADSST